MRRMTVVGRNEDGRLRRHGARAEDHRLRQVRRAALGELRRVADAHRRHLQSRRSRTTSRCDSSAGTSSRSSAARATPIAEAADGRRRRARASSSSSARSTATSSGPLMAHAVGENVVVYPGTVIGDGVPDRRSTRSSASSRALAALDREARAAARRSCSDPGRSSRGRDRLRGHDARRSGVIVGDQACVRERCTIGDDVVIGRGRARRERHDDRRRCTTIQANAYVTAYSTRRGRRLHRALRRDDERQLHGADREAATRCGGGRRSGAAPGSAAAPCSCRESRSARRRSSEPARSCCATFLRAPSSSATRPGRSATFPTRSCSGRAREGGRISPGPYLAIVEACTGRRRFRGAFTSTKYQAEPGTRVGDGRGRSPARRRRRRRCERAICVTSVTRFVPGRQRTSVGVAPSGP